MPSGCISKHPCTFCADLLMNVDHQPAPAEECLWYSVFLHASEMSSPSELALDEHSFNAFYLATLKYSSVWYSVLPRDVTDFSEASKMELVRFFHMPAIPGPRFIPVQEHG